VVENVAEVPAESASTDVVSETQDKPAN
jgi:hypothetical protein